MSYTATITEAPSAASRSDKGQALQQQRRKAIAAQEQLLHEKRHREFTAVPHSLSSSVVAHLLPIVCCSRIQHHTLLVTRLNMLHNA